MGREIRRVPPNWEHPRRDCHHEPWNGGCDEAKKHGGKCYQPLYDSDAETAWKEWLEEFTAWCNGGLAECIKDNPGYVYSLDEPYRTFCEWHGEPPDPKYYHRPFAEGEATWFQVYQTVSEGSPVTPPFSTKEELVDYLVANGDEWDQSRGKGGWSREAAERFVGMGWAPSMMVERTATSVTIKEPRDGI
jgi:hypothetical protein